MMAAAAASTVALSAVHQGDRGPLLGEEAPGRFPDAPAAARDEGDAPGHASRHERLRRR